MGVAPGSKLGIIGSTGSGKSSILNVLFRLNQISSGEIKIDGYNIQNVGLRLLREKIGFISQVPFIF